MRVNLLCEIALALAIGGDLQTTSHRGVAVISRNPGKKPPQYMQTARPA